MSLMADRNRKSAEAPGLGEALTPQMVPLLVSSLVVPLAAFMLYPFLIIYFTHSLGFSVAAAGLLLSVRFLASGLLGFLSGMLADRWGLARTYVLSGLITGLAIVTLASVTGIAAIVILLVIMGVSSSAVNAMARGLASQYVDENLRGTVQNIIHWLNNVGMAVALPFSAFVLNGGYSRIPFVVAALAYVVMAVIIGLAFVRHRPMLENSPKDAKTANPVGPWRVIRDDAAFVWLLLCFLLVVMVEMQFESGIPLDLSFHFAHGAKLYGALGLLDLAIVAVLQIPATAWLAKRRSKWYGYGGILLVGGISVGGVWQTPSGWIIAIVLLGLGDVFAYGQIFALMGVLPRPGRQGTYFSVFVMVQGFASFLAYALGGFVYQLFKPTVLFGLCLPAAILAAIFFRQALSKSKTRIADTVSEVS